ncbi:MAG TPA: glycosyltransferase family 2 protein, partial [Polyangiaceae bacterium]
MSEEVVPPVVAVVVAHDPGPWFEESLASLVDEEYPSLSILVVDVASTPPLAPRVAAVAPEVFIHRLEENRGFGPSANVVTRLVEGSTHYLFCHDDVMLDPGCLRRLVEEAFRQNAGIVAPKLVDYDQPDRILQLGLGVDRFGAPVRRVERREFDQSQHDEVREVFAAPGGCTLVRSDLFIALGGFDEEISMFGEDVDLCWRARLAGARVVIVPLAVARHLEATAARRRPLADARALQWRHELRAVLKNYGLARRSVTVAALVVLSVLESAYFTAVGRRERARQVVDAWRWNFAGERHLRAARATVRASRRISDRTLS